MKFYAGIGAGKTPEDILKKMSVIAKHYANTGYCLRSGGAYGADTAFEIKAKDKEIWLPYEEHYQRTSSFFLPDNLFLEKDFDKLLETTNKYMRWQILYDGLTARFFLKNTVIILGRDLKTPVNFVVCWTPKGEAVGGTGHAIRLAKAHDIPVYNLAVSSDYRRFQSLF